MEIEIEDTLRQLKELKKALKDSKKMLKNYSDCQIVCKTLRNDITDLKNEILILHKKYC